MKDTLEHRLSACGEGHKIWEYTKRMLARILQITPSRIPVEWLLRPQFKTWLFRSQQQRTLTLQDFKDFLKRARWKLTCSKKGETVWALI
jgi:hypothetical protein